jgi:hypothetical protein
MLFSLPLIFISIPSMDDASPLIVEEIGYI